MQKVGRNEPCHCGSGKKFKSCHGKINSKASPKMSTRSKIIGAIAVDIMILSVVMMVLNSQSSERGEAPPGKVWSEEHGHYH